MSIVKHVDGPNVFESNEINENTNVEKPITNANASAAETQRLEKRSCWLNALVDNLPQRRHDGHDGKSA